MGCCGGDRRLFMSQKIDLPFYMFWDILVALITPILWSKEMGNKDG